MSAAPSELHASPIIITGPTASGKGAVAHELARRTGGEIISMDSMKVYREMDVGTAKPSPERRAEVRYHLMDLVDPHVDFSVGDYLPLLETSISEVRERGHPVIVCGGTALYLKAYLEGFCEGPPADWALRSRLIDEASRDGSEVLHRRLDALDPDAARKIHPRDLRRIVRALEVAQSTGRAISARWNWGSRPLREPRLRIFGLAWERPELYRRIDLRVEVMVEKGLFEEALRLRERTPSLSRSASQSIGYKEIWKGCSDGLGREEITARVKQSTRRFAKSQLTWFRKLPMEWLSVGSRYDPGEIVEEILRRVAGGEQAGRS